MDLAKQALDMQKETSDFSVSVWVLTYRHGPFVTKALESILQQKTNFRVQIYLSDDHSPDNTLDAVHEVMALHPNVIQLTTHPHNIGATLNAYQTYARCFQSEAKYIAMLEGDDFWDDPYKLQKQVDYLESHPEISITWHDYEVVNEAGDLIQPPPIKGSLRSYTSEELKRITSIKTLTVCYRNVFTEMPPEYLDCPNGDTFLFAMLGQKGGAAFLPEIAPAKYRVHTGGVWSEKKTRQRDLLTLKSFAALAAYFQGHKDHETVLYYIDRYVKIQLLICFEDRSAGKYIPAFKTLFQTIRLILIFKLYKTLPHVLSQFAQVILLGKEIKWALRQATA
jgi:glycosyltransferase involved in cell wall biosynthesis